MQLKNHDLLLEPLWLIGETLTKCRGVVKHGSEPFSFPNPFGHLDPCIHTTPIILPHTCQCPSTQRKHTWSQGVHADFTQTAPELRTEPRSLAQRGNIFSSCATLLTNLFQGLCRCPIPDPKWEKIPLCGQMSACSRSSIWIESLIDNNEERTEFLKPRE